MNLTRTTIIMLMTTLAIVYTAAMLGPLFAAIIGFVSAANAESVFVLALGLSLVIAVSMMLVVMVSSIVWGRP
jgi:hypothetical protein